MPKGSVRDAFETTGGNTYYKAEDAAGRTYYVKEGGGRVSKQQFAAAKSHTPEAAVARRGESVESATRNVSKVEGDITVPTKGLPKGSLERAKGANRNKWLGFLNETRGPDPSDAERADAFEEYAEMVEALEDADSLEEREEIKDAFGVGGSP